MIVSVTCRHGTQANINRDEVRWELLTLYKYSSSIVRTQVIFSRETHHKSADDLVKCHLSIYTPNRHQIDIYALEPTELLAFDQAKARAIHQLSRSGSIKRKSIRRMPDLPPADLSPKNMALGNL